MNIRALAFALLLPLTGCPLFGVSPEDAEAARTRAENALVIGELALGFVQIGAAKYAALPDCGGAVAICKDPKVSLALSDGTAALAATLGQIRAALASDKTEAQRLAEITDALVSAAEKVNAIVAQLKLATPPAARAIGA